MNDTPTPTTKFNVNHYVRVKLTEVGCEIYRHRNDDVRPRFPGVDFGPIEPKLDHDGYLREQLWAVMSIFGQHLYNGGDLPFETEILLEADDVKDT